MQPVIKNDISCQEPLKSPYEVDQFNPFYLFFPSRFPSFVEESSHSKCFFLNQYSQ